MRALVTSLVVASALATLAPPPADAASEPARPGAVAFVKIANSRFDRYTRDPTASAQAWMRKKYWRMVGYRPYFDSRLSWFRDTWFYKDLYAIYADGPLADAHPEWILRDRSGAKLYIPYGCSAGRCPQYAADIGDRGFRAHWIAEAKAGLAAGYRGVFIDDVNMTVTRVGDGAGHPVAPVDRRTGAPMTEADWRRYMADFCGEIRAAFPGTELVHNALWFVGHDDPAVVRELESASWINLERGVNDRGIRGGGGTYGFETFLAHVEWLHARDKAVVFDAGGTTEAEREYGLATYFLVNGGRDGLGNDPGGTPDDWWSGYDVVLGAPRGARYAWHGVMRRDFDSGMVLVNQPEAPSQTVALDGAYADVRGRSRTSVTLGPAEGAVLVRSGGGGS